MTASDLRHATSHYAIRIPGQAPVDLSKHTLIDKNHKEHHIYFNTSGFHNHLIHHYLAAYSLGSDMNRLQDIFYAHASYQRPMPPSVRTLTRENYHQELCNREAYTSYLNLFKEEIKSHGVVETVRYWMFKDKMVAQMLGGAYHPLIHLGYGLEFDLPDIVAEAFAMGACTEPYPEPVMEYLTDQLEEGPPDLVNGTKTIMDLLNAVYKDPELEGVVKFTDELKSSSVLQSPKAVAKLSEYASQWHIKDIESAIQELLVGCILLFTTSGIRKEGIKLDFFLAHAVTSAHAVYTVLPYLTPIQAELLLRGHLTESLMYYLARGRPSLQLDLLLDYKSPQAVVRAIALAQTVYGNPSNNAILLKAAQVTVDIAGKSAAADVAFNFAGIGFEEAWEQQ
ncbi:hypothetical protein BDB00DRAFT_929747 [Zychaea mexicana]|uniref:uncharacterized protein n=1 Tax=Zychaea mexicana TaxID=64656 RepID=UPI0022FE082A|nr:uncharacterized protein BDB00DRAFT_929747 [Zychaea mexicana]KAI9492360.1 hypothetical protein BDB00DRAFT_929747 [Zychaea mexicana]